jgi:hypothetical protein
LSNIAAILVWVSLAVLQEKGMADSSSNDGSESLSMSLDKKFRIDDVGSVLIVAQLNKRFTKPA